MTCPVSTCCKFCLVSVKVSSGLKPSVETKVCLPPAACQPEQYITCSVCSGFRTVVCWFSLVRPVVFSLSSGLRVHFRPATQDTYQVSRNFLLPVITQYLSASLTCLCLTCLSGRWVVPCLSCSDNRTCDWRDVAWQPDGCYHQLVDGPLLQDCVMDRKVRSCDHRWGDVVSLWFWISDIKQNKDMDLVLVSVWYVDRCPDGYSPVEYPCSAVVYRWLDQSWDDVLPDGACQLQSAGLGKSSQHTGLQKPERGAHSGRLLILSSVLVGEETAADVQTGAAAAAQQVRGNMNRWKKKQRFGTICLHNENLIYCTAAGPSRSELLCIHQFYCF